MTAKNNRPTSPHLQVYRLPLTGIISISHRITGVFLSAGLLIFLYILFALSQGENAYMAMQGSADGWLGKLFYLGFVYALFFHLCHGVRHLWWDLGEGFEPDNLHKYALIELISALLLTLFAWIFI
ncbi:MAG: succinate dehydrogenase, cytochrome b556 subunit [Methyloglobulus sp.]|nr:succinate dehydrogenase, cytochrome b556 subunit [Methyloglobulus sp.]